MGLRKRQDESVSEYLLRLRESILLRMSPAFREKRRLERMVGPIGNWDALQRYQVNCLKALGLTPQHELLDIGCGPLQGGLAFIRYLDPGHYAGIDIREEAIEEARRQVVKAHLEDRRPFLAVSSTFGRDELGGRTFDFLWISQLLYHLDDTNAEACFAQAAARLRAGGRMVGDFIATDGPSEKRKDNWQGFTFYHRPFAFFEELGARHGLRMIPRGKLRDHGYPTKRTFNLSLNELLEFHKR